MDGISLNSKASVEALLATVVVVRQNCIQENLETWKSFRKLKIAQNLQNSAETMIFSLVASHLSLKKALRALITARWV